MSLLVVLPALQGQCRQRSSRRPHLPVRAVGEQSGVSQMDAARRTIRGAAASTRKPDVSDAMRLGFGGAKPLT